MEGVLMERLDDEDRCPARQSWTDPRANTPLNREHRQPHGVPRGRRLHSGDRADLPAAAERLPVPAAGTDPGQGHGRAGHLVSGRKEPMIGRAPAISGTTPSPGYRASSTVGKIAEQGPPTEGADEMEDTAKEPGVWPWPDSLDAVVAAPGSHRVVLENELTRVLEVMIAAGEREPEHTHRWSSVMVVHRPARIRYYSGDALTFASPEQPSPAASGPRVSWLDPEGPHSVENIDDHPYGALRIELKQR